MNVDNIGNFFDGVIKTIVTEFPNLFQKSITIFSNIFQKLMGVIQSNMPGIINAFGNMFFAVAEAMPGIIDTLFDTIATLLAGLGDYLTSNQQRLENDLKNIVDSIVKGITKFIESGGLKKLLDGLLAVQQAIENAVADNIDEIADFIEEALPDIAEFLENSIVSASKTLGKIAPRLLKALGGIIGTIFAVAFDPDVIESSFDAIEGIISGLIQAIVNFVIKIIPALIEGIVRAPEAIPKLITGIISGLIDGLTSVNWLDVVKSVFEGFINGFKELFGIHSPSTVFEGFGNNITEGLEIGLKGFTEVLEVLLEPLETVVNNLTDFSKTGEGFEKMFKGIADVVKISGKVIIGVLGGVVQAMADVHNELRDIIKGVTTIKVWTPWKTYNIGGVDIGSVTAPDISKYISIIDALADGTNNARKGLTLVGEAGPELVNFRGGEQVLNNRNTQKALDNIGGSTNNFNVTFNNLQDTSAFTMMQQLKAYNRQMAINGIL
jgi:phage-related protein